MKRFFICIKVFVLLFLGCEKEDTPPELAKINPTGESIGFFENGIDFTSDASQKDITFSANTDWVATIVKSGDDEWCSISKSKGGAGTGSITLSVLENNSYSSREKIILLQVSDIAKTINIRQKKLDAIIISDDSIHVDQAGGSINVEVAANIEYSVIIPEESNTWISQSSTKSLSIQKLTFDVAVNNENEFRSGQIILKSTTISDTVFVTQDGGKYLEITNDTYSLSSSRDTIEVEVLSNFDFDILLPSSEPWVRQLSIRKDGSKSIISYVIESNETYVSRIAEITFFEKEGNLTKKINIIQSEKNTILISKNTFDINSKGGDLKVIVMSNIEFDITIPNNITWLSLKEIESNNVTEGLATKSLIFNVSGFEADNSRSAVVKLANASKEVSETITINQSGLKDVFWGNITLSSRQDLEDFKNAGYKKIVGNLYIDTVEEISGLYWMGNSLEVVTGDIYINGAHLGSLSGLNSLVHAGSITIDRYAGYSLSGLNNLVSIEHNLELLNECRPLSSFQGLENLKTIGGNLELRGDVYDFHELRNFKGLDNLESIGKNFELRAEFVYLESFEGLQNLKEIGGNFYLMKASRSANSSFDNLRNFNGLNSLVKIGGAFYLAGSFDNLHSFEGLENLITIGSICHIGNSNFDNSTFNALVSFHGLENLESIGGHLSMSSLASSFNSLVSLEGLEKINSLGGLSIDGNNQSFQSFNSFEALHNLKEIHGDFEISDLTNNKITSLAGFNNLSIVTGNFNLRLQYIETLEGLENLREARGRIEINNCERLKDIYALSSLRMKVEGSSYYNNFSITNCRRLYDFCPLSNLFESFNGTFTFTGNGYNPTAEQIINGECSIQ